MQPASPGPQHRNRVQTKSGAPRAMPRLSALTFMTTAAMTKRLMSASMAVANERAIFGLVNIAVSPVNCCSHPAGVGAHLVGVHARGKSDLCTAKPAAE